MQGALTLSKYIHSGSKHRLIYHDIWGFVFFMNIFSFRTILDKKLPNLQCVFLKCPPMQSNTICWKARCGLYFWSNHIKVILNNVSQKHTKMYKFLPFWPILTYYIIAIIHNLWSSSINWHSCQSQHQPLVISKCM